MKYIKKFETIYNSLNHRTTKPNFNVGDTVICIDIGNNNPYFNENEKYIVDDIFQNDGTWFCTIKGKVRENNPIYFFCSRFKPNYEIESDKYNL